MEGVLDINAFMEHLEARGLMIAPRNLVEASLKDAKLERLQKAALSKKALSFKEIADAQLWGPIGTRAVKKHAQKYAKDLEIFETAKGQIIVNKLIISAVKRIAKSRGITWD